MSNLTPTNLSDLALRINTLVDESKALYSSAIANIKCGLESEREIGELLMEAKSVIPHGQFISWVETNCQFGIAQANRCMRIARNWDKIMTKLQEDTNSKLITRDQFDGSDLLSFRSVLSFFKGEPNVDKPVEEKKSFKVASQQHECFGEVVEVVAEHSQGEVIVCKTSLGDIPFLKKELIDPQAEVEIVATVTTDPELDSVGNEAEKIREAIALVIEFLPAESLKLILTQSLDLGSKLLPEQVNNDSLKLLNAVPLPF